MAAEDSEEKLVEKVAVVDFDMLCATVAMQAHGISVEKNRGKEADEDDDEEAEIRGELAGGVQRLWEGDVLDCFADRRIAIETSCCPCYRFGKNMRRANLGSCFLQGTTYFMLTAAVLFNIVAFAVAEQHWFLYAGAASAITFGVYLGYFRYRIRKRFNIRGSDSYVDDCVNHLICPNCSLCQESRTLEMNNVQDGVWHGRGDTIFVGAFSEASKVTSALCDPPSVTAESPELCRMERGSGGDEHRWSSHTNQSEPLVPSE